MPKNAYPGTIIPKLYGEYPSAAAALRAVRAAGGHIRTSDFQAIWREYGNRLAMGAAEQGKDLRFKPTDAEVMPMGTVRATGLMQEVVIFGRSRSGDLITKRIEVPVEELKSRQWAIKRAEEVASGFLPASEQHRDTELVKVLGGIHVGAYERYRL